MFFGPDRFDLAGEEFLRLVQDDLARSGRPGGPADAASVLGLTPDELWDWLDRPEPIWLRELVARWNAQAPTRGLTPIVLIDHGDEVELFIGLLHPTA